MPLISDNLYVGGTLVDKVYLGSSLVWDSQQSAVNVTAPMLDPSTPTENEPYTAIAGTWENAESTTYQWEIQGSESITWDTMPAWNDMPSWDSFS